MDSVISAAVPAAARVSSAWREKAGQFVGGTPCGQSGGGLPCETGTLRSLPALQGSGGMTTDFQERHAAKKRSKIQRREQQVGCPFCAFRSGPRTACRTLCVCHHCV